MVTAMFTDSEAFALLNAIGEEVRSLTHLIETAVMPDGSPVPVSSVRMDLWRSQRAALRTASIALRDGINADPRSQAAQDAR